MIFTEKIREAIDVAAAVHDWQYRKGGHANIPYISHPFAVAMMVSEFCGHENYIIAALLHDTIEDQPERCHWFDSFPPEVERLVRSLTDPKPKGVSYRERKLAFIEQVFKGGPFAITISACDKIDNMRAVRQNLECGKPTGTRPISDLTWYWNTFRDYLVNKGWEGDPVCDSYQRELSRLCTFISNMERYPEAR